MNDVLKVALDRQRELREEIAELDGFIRTAEDLLQRTLSRAEPRRERAERPQAVPRETERPAISAVDRPAERPSDHDRHREQHAGHRDEAGHQPAAQPQRAVAEALRAAAAEEGRDAPEQSVRKYPWTGAQPAVRRSSGDEPAGPTRKNIFRRDLSATG